MAFVNEIVSEEDIQKYGLDDLKMEFDHFGWINGKPEGFSHAWTIDRYRDIYFMLVKMVEEVGPSGRPQPTSKDVFILNIQGKRIQVLLDRVRCPKSFSDSPFIIGWNLLEISMPPDLDLSKAESVIQILKEALTVYGYRGAKSKQSPNAIVEFNF